MKIKWICACPGVWVLDYGLIRVNLFQNTEQKGWYFRIIIPWSVSLESDIFSYFKDAKIEASEWVKRINQDEVD